MQIPFGVQSAEGESTPLSAQRAINCYLQVAPPKSKELVAMPRAAGIRPFSTPAGVPRGAIKWRKVLYAVHGQTLYRIAANGVSTAIGLIEGERRVWMTASKTQLAISNGIKLYVYDGSALSVVTDPDFPGCTWIVALDGYTIFGFPSGDEFGITAINDATDYDALDFAAAEGAPDALIGALVDHREVFLMGEDTGEVWWNSGNADFPLERTGSGYLEIGIAGPYAIGKKANSVFFLGTDGIAYTLNGYSEVRISTHEIETQIKKQTRADCIVETWTERGHAFVAFRFPNLCVVYDIGTQLWHERQTYGHLGWEIGYVVSCYESVFVGATGAVGELVPDYYGEFAAPQVMLCRSAAISDGNAWIEHNRLELIFETGVGLLSGQGSDPKVMLRWSDDGGRTWPGENARIAGLGKTGKTEARVIFTRMGRARDRVYEMSVSDPVKVWFFEARLNEAA